MAENYPSGQKTLWEKEKLLVTSNFSFSHSVFKRLVLQARKKQRLVWERDIVYANSIHLIQTARSAQFDLNKYFLV